MDSLFPPWVGMVLVGVMAAALAWSAWRWRAGSRRRAWGEVAARMEGAVESAQPLRVRGRWRGYPAFLQQAVSYEDAVAYHHTRGALNIRNPACVVMGLRHKSVLEEVATRREVRPVETGDPDFDRAFFLLLTVPEHVISLLSPKTRRALLRYADVEVYLRSTQIEWRRSGVLTSAREMLTLFDVLSDMADWIETLPPRSLTLSQKMADEALIENGL